MIPVAESRSASIGIHSRRHFSRIHQNLPGCSSPRRHSGIPNQVSPGCPKQYPNPPEISVTRSEMSGAQLDSRPDLPLQKADQ
ncbi:hypothetical protein PCANC_03084 [Puccinia coronata f. sp. avenae]|uniref:Uncharacterized protein n=1 Tax=Puccinia coronata f. sp. avenae TaxID=200324 RepID=A0A2N5W4Q3_9BASI|nr:hypothetical protein PCANC_07334 [Puccinia coronata f. sp. avenae]PLW57202.1 hypothetical protein PCANC_03084 [Puccinia coronata f. sp. avenae]